MLYIIYEIIIYTFILFLFLLYHLIFIIKKWIIVLYFVQLRIFTAYDYYFYQLIHYFTILFMHGIDSTFHMFFHY